MAKYKVGNKVRIVKRICGHAFDIGEIVEIVEVGFCDYKAKNNNDYWWVTNNEIELVNKFTTKDSGKRKEFKSGMVRDIEEDKPRYDLLYFPMLKRWAELMARGAKKYGEGNWEKAEGEEELNRFKASALRHMIQWFEGQEDEDHASAVMFNISGAEMVKAKINGTKEKRRD